MIVLFFTVSLTMPVYATSGNQMYGDGIPKGSQEVYFHTDHLGSTAVTTNGSGSVQSRVVYDSWGKMVKGTGDDDYQPKFAGAERGPGQEGLLYMGSRIYDTDLRRFLSPDPQKQMASPYRYASDPISQHDPSGEAIMAIIGILVGAIVSGFVVAGNVAGTFKFWEWDRLTWGYFFAGAVYGVVLGAAGAFAGPAALAATGVKAGTWSAFAVSSAVNFGMGMAGALAEGMLTAAGLNKGMGYAFGYMADSGFLAGSVGIAMGALMKGAGQGLAKLAKK